MKSIRSRLSLRRQVLATCLLGLVGQFGPVGQSDFALAQPAAKSKPVVEKAQPTEESWHVIYLGNQRIGYEHSRGIRERRGKDVVVVSEAEARFTLKRFGQELTMSTSLRTEESETGDLLRFVFEMKNPPALSTKTEGVVSGSDLELTTTNAGRVEKRRIAWEAGAKSPAYPDRLLREQPIKAGETRTAKVFTPEFNKFSRVSVTAEDARPIKLLDGSEKSLLKVIVTSSVIPESKSRHYLDENGRARVTEIDIGGLQAKSHEVSRDVALQAIAGAELDIAVGTLVRIHPPIRDAHQTQRIVYRITAPGESPDRYFVNGGSQQVKSVGHGTVEVTVTSRPIPPNNSKVAMADAQYLAATRFLQSRDPAVVEHADKAAGGETDASRIATRMERYVHDKLTKKNFSTAMATAAEVAQRLEGDCTEHAVLLAAMLRAKKIPSRIAAGLVYVESLSSFGGHMWTEAFLGGDWIPLDATLGRGKVGAAHLKMSESPLDEDSPLPVTTFLPLYQALGKLKIDVIQAE